MDIKTFERCIVARHALAGLVIMALVMIISGVYCISKQKKDNYIPGAPVEMAQ